MLIIELGAMYERVLHTCELMLDLLVLLLNSLSLTSQLCEQKTTVKTFSIYHIFDISVQCLMPIFIW